MWHTKRNKRNRMFTIKLLRCCFFRLCFTFSLINYGYDQQASFLPILLIITLLRLKRLADNYVKHVIPIFQNKLI